MDYKGFSISDTQSALLYDILQTQQEILAELKKLNNKPVKAATVPQDEPESTDEELPIPEVAQVEKPITDVQNEVKKSTRKPAKRRQTKKKSQSKKATK